MKGFLSRALATVALTLCVLPIAAQTTPTYSDETVISFLGSPTKAVGPGSDLTSEYLMSLLNENAKKYVKSFEWNNIKTLPHDDEEKDGSKIGVQIESTNGGTVGYITINFNDGFIANAGRVILYGGRGTAIRDELSSHDGHNVEIDAIVNNELPVALGAAGNAIKFEFNFKRPTIAFKEWFSQLTIDPSLSNYSSKHYKNPCYKILRTKGTETSFPLKSIKFTVKPSDAQNDGFALHGIKILHNGFVENDINTGVEEIAQENGAVEYFDLYGRRLADKPTQGLFIEKRGSKVTKLLAR